MVNHRQGSFLMSFWDETVSLATVKILNKVYTDRIFFELIISTFYLDVKHCILSIRNYNS
jgi:hypothetical protein